MAKSGTACRFGNFYGPVTDLCGLSLARPSPISPYSSRRCLGNLPVSFSLLSLHQGETGQDESIR